MNIRELGVKDIDQLHEICKTLDIKHINSKQDMFLAIIRKYAAKETLLGTGVLEIVKDSGFGFLRSKDANYSLHFDDIYVAHNQIRKFALRNGDYIEGVVTIPKDNEKYLNMQSIKTINGLPSADDKAKIRKSFDTLTPIFPKTRINIDADNKDIISRIIAVTAPIGKGQRCLIVAPPKSGKTTIMKALAKAIEDNNPDITLMVLLVDERPEEVTDMKATIKSDVISSTFDEPPNKHVSATELVLDRAKRLVEQKKDVVIVMDSITRLARAYNAVEPSSGRLLTGGLDANALQKPKRFFGAARNVVEGGSLTIIATALIDTGSRMDDIIFEEFKGTGNAEIVLDRSISERRIFPAIDITKSGTRKEELLISEGILKKTIVLRRILASMNIADAASFLIEKIKLTDDNEHFFESMNK